MFRNYLTIALRNMIRHKGFTAINLAGLAVGIACVALILLWVDDELSYDHFQKNLKQICRVVGAYDGHRVPTTAGPMAFMLKAEIPEIATATRFKNDATIFQYGDKILRAEGINAEPAFLDIFTFPEIRGDCKAALDDPSSIVLTETTAKKLFGEEEPLGKVIKLSNKWTAKVAGIVRDAPANSSPPLKFEYLASFKIYYFWRDPDSWTKNSDYQTWVLLSNASSTEIANQKIDALIRRHNWDPKLKIYLQPMEEIHLRANTDMWDGPHGDIRYVLIFSLLGFIILAIACINFTNMSTARSMLRTKEVGVRKVMGAGRNQLIRQFLSESFIFALLSLPVSHLLVELALPTFNRLASKNLELDFADSRIFIGSFALLMCTGLLSGIYPALYLSALKPVGALKGGLSFGLKENTANASLRKILVVSQFALSIIVIICSLTVYNQLAFLSNKKLGFDKENLLYVRLGSNYSLDSYQSLKSELRQQSGILCVGGSDQIPIDTDFVPTVRWFSGSTQQSAGFPAFMVDEDYLSTYEMEIVQGRFFSREFATDREQAFVVNEAAVKMMGMPQPLGEKLEVYDRKGLIIGVVKDFHFETLRKEIQPLFIIYQPQCFFVNIRISSQNMPGTISRIEEILKKHYPGIPFEFHFIDKQIEQLYITEQRMRDILLYSSLLAVFLSSLGLYGLVTFAVERRTKEIGVRKVLGAPIAGIVSLLTKEFTKWILLANLIAWPIAWYTMDKWLQNFAYRADMNVWLFTLAGGLALGIAFLTVSAQAIKAALANPVESLRYE